MSFSQSYNFTLDFIHKPHNGTSLSYKNSKTGLLPVAWTNPSRFLHYAFGIFESKWKNAIMSQVFLTMMPENPAISSKIIHSDIDNVNMLSTHRGTIYSTKLQRLLVRKTWSNLNFIWLHHPIGVISITFNQNKYKLFDSKTIIQPILHNWVFFPLRLTGVRILINKSSELFLSLFPSNLPSASSSSLCLNN